MTLIVFRAGKGKTRHFFGYASDLGPGGMFIPSVNPRQQGEECSIAFRIPGGGEWIECRCRVIRRQEYAPGAPSRPGFGVQFLNLPQDMETAIRKRVESRRRT